MSIVNFFPSSIKCSTPNVSTRPRKIGRQVSLAPIPVIAPEEIACAHHVCDTVVNFRPPFSVVPEVRTRAGLGGNQVGSALPLEGACLHCRYLTVVNFRPPPIAAIDKNTRIGVGGC